ncbi:MAG: transcriptional regulator protein [Candidatus Scalindua rubra]|uniref:Transcriptional regulator protein n=1 Tax=Candidatus Scalindua rubra TaxID=1872076 RepID=A0A1E3XFY4_9BACT|nr:MAG: transcriptional regulator protein [Candidatus Scalindua rubra]
MPEYQKEELTDYHILKTIENDASISQRRLSSQMELNVASVNFALRRLIKKGFIRMVGANPRRIKYYITPEGLREKTQLAYSFFGRNFHFYKEVRNDIETRIIKATNGSKTRIAIYGVNELSEITYMYRNFKIIFFVCKPRRINNN